MGRERETNRACDGEGGGVSERERGNGERAMEINASIENMK